VVWEVAGQIGNIAKTNKKSTGLNTVDASRQFLQFLAVLAMLAIVAAAFMMHEEEPMSAKLGQEVLRYADLIEAEMRRIGYWQNQPLQSEQMQFRTAFAMDTVTFTQWLQFVFLPHVREAAVMNQLPSGSSVATQAIREFDGNANAGELVTLLSEFDVLFD
jgi:uncharacterized protein YqcC (DUF446 family)